MSAADPRVSVIMAVYNEQAFLAEAIESVLAQDFGDYEVIVSDDGSTDAHPEIAARSPRAIPSGSGCCAASRTRASRSR